jgi:acid phosphatase
MLFLLALPAFSVLDKCVAPRKFAPIPHGYKLRHIQVVTRHGARTPRRSWFPVSNRGSWICDSDVAYAGRIEAVPLIHPRRIRTLLDPRLADFPPNCLLGELTVEGMDQHFRLGAAYRKWLVDELQFLSPELDPAEICARSTSLDRTFRSALSFMHGLYEPRTFDEVLPISTGTNSFDAMRLHGRFCGDLNGVLHDFAVSQKYREFLADAGAVLKDVRDYLGEERWDDTTADDLCDWIIQMHCSEQMMPPIVNESHVRLCFSVNGKGLVAPFAESEETAAIGFSYGMKEMLRILDRFNAQVTKHKFVLLSAHDSTIAVLLVLLGHKREAIPPFASHIAMQILENGQKEQFVRFVFNGDELELPAFGDRKLVKLDEFVPNILKRIERYCK